MKSFKKFVSFFSLMSLLISIPVWSTENVREVQENLTSVKSLSIAEQPDYNQLMHTAYDSIENKNLKGVIDPEEVMDCINKILYPKYMALGHTNFATQATDVDSDTQQEIKEFVTKNADHLGIITDPKMMIFFLRMLQPVDVKPEWFTVYISELGINSIKSFFSNNLLHLTYDKFFEESQNFINFKKFNSDLMNLINDRFFDPAQCHNHKLSRQMTVQDIINRLNIFMINGKKYHDISTDSEALNTLFNNWFKINRALMFFEIKEWEEKAFKLKRLDEDYNFVKINLNTNNNKLYSGLATGSYSLSLIRISKQELAEETQTLRDFAREEYESYAQARIQYEETKPAISVFKRALAWLDEIADILKKNGRMS